jgi:hypothetical protein
VVVGLAVIDFLRAPVVDESRPAGSVREGAPAT